VNTSISYPIARLAGSTCGAVESQPGSELTCCDAVRDATAALLSSSLEDFGAHVWAQLICQTLCAASQGQWSRWRRREQRLPAPALTLSARSETPTMSFFDVVHLPRLVDNCSPGGANVANVSCCVGVALSLDNVRPTACATTLHRLLYAAHCISSMGGLPICANYSQLLFDACADEPVFGYPAGHTPRQVFANPRDFLHTFLPVGRTADIAVSAAAGCIAPAAGAPAQVCADLVGWVSAANTGCGDYASLNLCTVRVASTILTLSQHILVAPDGRDVCVLECMKLSLSLSA
jgi:hypothetical protein